MKTFFTFLMGLGALLFLGGCQLFSETEVTTPVPAPVPALDEPAVSDSPETAPVESTDGWETFVDEEIGVSFNVPADVTVREKTENAQFEDLGNMKEDSANAGSFSLIAASQDYGQGISEGCCWSYAGATLDLSLSDTELTTEIENELGEIHFFERTEVGGMDAVRFIRKNGYIGYWYVETVLIPYEKNGFTNIMISGPKVFETEMNDEGEILETGLADFFEQYPDISLLERADYKLFVTILSTVNFL